MPQTPAHMKREIKKFNRLAGDWWNPNGPMAPLHALNPPRLSFIYEQLAAAGIGKGARGLDLGCGAGLLTEPLARYGFRMTGLDGAADAIGVAQTRAAAEGLDIDYRVGESGSAKLPPVDFVNALEIIEHTDDPAAFLRQALAPLKPGGLLFLSTLNRTLKSRLVAIWGAEYLLRLLPAGTHDWQAFLKPSELVALADQAGGELLALEGLSYDLHTRSFRRDARDLSINYILCVRKR